MFCGVAVMHAYYLLLGTKSSSHAEVTMAIRAMNSLKSISRSPFWSRSAKSLSNVSFSWIFCSVWKHKMGIEDTVMGRAEWPFKYVKITVDLQKGSFLIPLLANPVGDYCWMRWGIMSWQQAISNDQPNVTNSVFVSLLLTLNLRLSFYSFIEIIYKSVSLTSYYF